MALTDTEIINFDIVEANTKCCTSLTVVLIELNPPLVITVEFLKNGEFTGVTLKSRLSRLFELNP